MAGAWRRTPTYSLVSGLKKKRTDIPLSPSGRSFNFFLPRLLSPLHSKISGFLGARFTSTSVPALSLAKGHVLVLLPGDLSELSDATHSLDI